MATKMFTGIAIGQLVEAGKIGFDTRLVDAWPEYPNHAVAERITIAQMLTHTSGLREGLTPTVQVADTPFRTLDAAVRVSAGEPLLFEPGTNWPYSNLGYMVLGRVIERISKTSYREYVKTYILEPAGMTETDDIDVTAVVPGLAVGYSRAADDPLGIREPRANWPVVLGFGCAVEIVAVDASPGKVPRPGAARTVWSRREASRPRPGRRGARERRRQRP